MCPTRRKGRRRHRGKRCRHRARARRLGRRAHRHVHLHRRCCRAGERYGQPGDPDRRAAGRRAQRGRRRVRRYRRGRRRHLGARARQYGANQTALNRLARADGRLAQVRGPVAYGGPCQQDRPVELPARVPGCAYYPQPHQDLGGTDGRLLVRTQAHGFRCRHDRYERCCQDGRHGQGREVL